MPVKLIVTDKQEGGIPKEHSFQDLERIVVGRGRTADLVLTDPQKHLGREHAELRRVGADYEIADLGSRNFTYLSGERLEAAKAYPIGNGDVFTLGSFEIQFVHEALPAPAEDITIVDWQQPNPLPGIAAEFADVVSRLRHAYAEVPLPRRDVAMAEATAATATAQNVDDQVEIEQLLQVALLGGTTKSAATFEPPSDSSALATAFDTLAALIKVPWNFRAEYADMTVALPDAELQIFKSTGPELIEYIFDDSATGDERQARIEAFGKMCRMVERHQAGVVEGYKASIAEGTRRMMDSTDPQLLLEAAKERSKLFQILPLLAGPAVLKQVQEAIDKVKGEDFKYAESQWYRPPFVTAYLNRIDDRR